MNRQIEESKPRRTFAIISHPDAGKTTITEKLLLLGQVIQTAGSVGGKKGPQATSDWMDMERERGISVTSSVMQFPYKKCLVNLLDTPGHEDFSEDTYRTLTAVDSALMVIDGAKGVEERTVKLMNVCRLRSTPIVSFINKMDRDIREPIELLDEIESVLKIKAAPINWPIGMGSQFLGVYDLVNDVIHVYKPGHRASIHPDEKITGLSSGQAEKLLGDTYDAFCEEVELVRAASNSFDKNDFLMGRLTPIFFGSALGNFGVHEMLNSFVDWAPSPQIRSALTRDIDPSETAFTGFVFKIQANMDPRHRDRIAFLRICSGRFSRGMKVFHVRTEKKIKLADAVSFKAGERILLEQAEAGDIIGLHNHGTIKIGDTFTSGEQLQFTGIPNFAPELFRKIRLRDPIKSKQLKKGLAQLAEEGSTQVFVPLDGGDSIVGAIGQLQFDMVSYRLREEYQVEAVYEPVSIFTARWVSSRDEKIVMEFRKKASSQLFTDSGGHLAFLASSRANLSVIEERWPDLEFSSTREN